ncbi:MAG: Eco57I restriction-modification methylase domain-containing protein [Candidatus Hodarchaeota archaeon]
MTLSKYIIASIKLQIKKKKYSSDLILKNDIKFQSYMQDFIDYLNKENIIQNLKNYYKNDIDSQIEDNLTNKVIENLSLINNIDFSHDIFINIYNHMRNHEEKKALGEFYTPISVVKYILNGVGYNYHNQIETKRVADISCGSGSFLIHVIRNLIKRFLEIYNRKEISELTVQEAKEIISRVKNNITGIDINRIACILCQINIYYVLFDILKFIQKSDPIYQVPVFDIKNVNTLTFDITDKYDFVVGNPPYLFIRDIPINQRKVIEDSKFETNKGQYDYYQIFIELGLKFLKKQGLLGYIVPDSLLALSNRSIIRKYIYNRTQIKEIYYTGPMFNNPVVSNIIVILKKENNTLKRDKNHVKIKISNHQENMIPQKVIEKWGYKFLIHLNESDISILEHLNTNFHRLKDLTKQYDIQFLLNRGVELTKTGKVIFCENCNKYLPIPRKILKCHQCGSFLNRFNIENIIYETIPTDLKPDNFKLYISSIRRYCKPQYNYINTSKAGINYKNLTFYENRIVIRQISQNGKICATYDKNLSLTSQSFYNLKILGSPISEFNNYYLLGIINSTLLSYYFIKSFGRYKKLFPRILIEKVKDLPIFVPIFDKEKEKAEKIIEYVKIILEKEKKIDHLQRKIDFLVCDLYQISDNTQKYILNYFKSLNS